MKTFIVLLMNNWISTPHGWGNGYVHLPKGHKYYGKHYDEIPVDVHGGLTYSEQEGEYWVVGFDTSHLGDNQENWTKGRVLEETRRLEEQLNK